MRDICVLVGRLPGSAAWQAPPEQKEGRQGLPLIHTYSSAWLLMIMSYIRARAIVSGRFQGVPVAIKLTCP